MQEAILGISLVGFFNISVMIFNSRKNDSLIRNLCERIAKLEGMLEALWVEKSEELFKR